MAAGLTIAILLALSVALVRIAAVAMRLTGLPEHIARFQCMSALTGTGFTTQESEMIVNYPIRRRVLVALMVLGNLGMVSVGTTFIVAFVGTDHDPDAVTMQVVIIILAIGFTLFVMTNKRLDRIMCSFIGFILSRTTSLGKRRYQSILQLDNGFSIAEHVVTGTRSQRIGDISLAEIPLTLLAVRTGKTRQFRQISEELFVSPGDIFICFGSETAHDSFENLMTRPHTTHA